jgi:hypothetical protein
VTPKSKLATAAQKNLLEKLAVTPRKLKAAMKSAGLDYATDWDNLNVDGYIAIKDALK